MGETLASNTENRSVRLTGSRDQYRTLSCTTKALLRKDNERYVKGLAEDIESHLHGNDLRPAYRALKKLRSKPATQVSTIGKISDMNGQRTRWTEYFELLYKADHSSG